MVQLANTEASHPRISVLLPVHNGESELQETVDYILGQSFQDFEVLIMDDASTDDTWELMQRLADSDARIRIFQAPTNLGIVKALNRLACEAQGEILIREDCGDISDPRRYELQYEILKKNPDAVACVTDYWRVDLDGSVVALERIPSTPESIRAVLAERNLFAHASFAMRKSAFDQVGQYDETMYCSQDYDLLIKLSKLGPILSINAPLVALRYNPTGITFRNAKKQNAHADFIRSRHFNQPAPETLDPPPLSQDEATTRYHRIVGKLHLAKGRPELARKHFRAAWGYFPDAWTALHLILSYVPGSVIRGARRLFGKKDDVEVPFFDESLKP